MPRAAGLFLDTDVLIQLFISKSQNILRHLRDDYGVQSIVLPEVATELSSSRKFGTRFVRDLRRALQARWLYQMNVNSYAEIVNSDPALQHAATGISFSDIEKLGREYNIRVDRGEAYTLAAAVLLSQPAASNDMSAISVLEANGYQVPIPTLRTFDLFAFAYQTGFKSKSDCDKIRKALLTEKERLPAQWKNASFEKGLECFESRLIDSDLDAIRASTDESATNHYTTPLFLTKPQEDQ